MTSDILRRPPALKNKCTYPLRYTKEDFETYRRTVDTRYISDYNKWCDGINYQTNRKIKIGGETHEKISRKFYVGRYPPILFTEFAKINETQYLTETKNIQLAIDKLNQEIDLYNEKAETIIHQIDELSSWMDYVEFEGNLYGISEISTDLYHRKNNCGGKMVPFNKVTSQCNKCENGMWPCGYDCSTTTYRYQCNTCGYIKEM